ncbi:hypothetical protein BDF14DRAFT_477737 [Spinellus fusiger]|nr:hypothetical protein BDF14DRAFT_477737 [Spinellus fusiger]
MFCGQQVQAIMAKFESSSAMFATLGKFDRLVTVWHPTSAKEYAFIHLAHPRSVSYFAWKALSNKSKLTHQPSDCALFTMARDGIGRFWSSIDPEKPHAFYMCAVIDPNQSLMTSETSSRLSQDSNMYHADHIEDTSPIHYINCNELRSAVCAQSQSYSRHDKLNQRIKKVQELVRETPDLLFRVQSDGSLTFWGVKYLNVFPKRIPRVFVVSRIAQAIDPSDVCYFLNPIQAFYDPSSGIKPVELSLITQNPHGQIRCYGIHIVDFLEQGHFIPRLYLKYAWMGHKYPIKSISPPYANRLCSTGIDGEMNIWKYELREVSNYRE